jgi:Tol biopolymer transport system component
MIPTNEAGENAAITNTQSASLIVYPVGPNGPRIEPQTLFSYPVSSDCDIDHLFPSPNSIHLILEFNCHANAFILLYDLTKLTVPILALDRGYFLNWSPDGNWFLFRHIDTNQIILITADGSTQVVLDKLPFGTYNATFTLDGKQIIYAASKGLGFGSEMGVLELAGNNLVIQKQFTDQITAFPRWSPDGNQLAYILLADNNIPYTIGELWLNDGSEAKDVLLAEVDAGRGYPPVWLPDGKSIVYVQRENPLSLQADYLANALHSNLYQVDTASHEIAALTTFTETLVYDPVWQPGGNQLAFTAGDAIWLVEPGQPPIRLTETGIARYAAWITLPESNP